jgi:uncharacterized damage-inducible protein DinB
VDEDTTYEGDTLEAFYRGWETYQTRLIEALAPLTPEQFALKAAPELRPIQAIARHMIGARARWMHRALGEGDESIVALAGWDGPEAPARTAEELVGGLRTTWASIRAALTRWSPDDMARPFTLERQGKTHTFTTQWIIWHLMEHDLHHGGEISFSLGMHGLAAPDI